MKYEEAVPKSRLTESFATQLRVGGAPAALKQKFHRSACTYLYHRAALLLHVIPIATAFVKQQFKIQRNLFFRDILRGMICTAKWMGPSCNH